MAVGLLATSCGGKSAAPGVANLTNGGTTTSTTTTSARRNGSIPPNAGFAGGNVAMRMSLQDGAKYSACMRKNGVPNFPDPNAQGVIALGPSTGVNPGSPKFQSAVQTCRTQLPNGGRPTPAQIAKAQQTALEFSKCMRAHGLPDFPDPTFTNGGGIGIKIQANGGLNPNDPRFKKAQLACNGRLFPKGPPSTSAGPK